MITHVRIQNFRSFVDAEVDLQPFSLVVGANGSGKSNFLRLFQTVSGKIDGRARVVSKPMWVRHQNLSGQQYAFEIQFKTGETTSGNAFQAPGEPELLQISHVPEWQGQLFSIFNLSPDNISNVEPTIPSPKVEGDGSGTCQVLDVLKNGDREDLFDAIQLNLTRYVPEAEKLSLKTVNRGEKQIQVRETGLNDPTPATELSEGTRLIICILTILHQEDPPAVILLEDIDRGMHPRLFEQIAPLIRDIAERNEINIIATTQNPYLVDCFRDHQDAVIVVEKVDGASTLTTLAEKMKNLDYESVDPDDMPLGALWYSGLVGGVPAKDSHDRK